MIISNINLNNLKQLIFKMLITTKAEILKICKDKINMTIKIYKVAYKIHILTEVPLHN